MALIVELAEEELTVGAIHRLITGLPAGFDLLGALAAGFELTPDRRRRRAPSANG